MKKVLFTAVFAMALVFGFATQKAHANAALIGLALAGDDKAGLGVNGSEEKPMQSEAPKKSEKAMKAEEPKKEMPAATPVTKAKKHKKAKKAASAATPAGN